MGVAKKVYTCDCCGYVINEKNSVFERHFYKIPYYYVIPYTGVELCHTNIVCAECMDEVGKRIRTKREQNTVNFEVI